MHRLHHHRIRCCHAGRRVLPFLQRYHLHQIYGRRLCRAGSPPLRQGRESRPSLDRSEKHRRYRPIHVLCQLRLVQLPHQPHASYLGQQREHIGWHQEDELLHQCQLPHRRGYLQTEPRPLQHGQPAGPRQWRHQRLVQPDRNHSPVPLAIQGSRSGKR